VCTCIVFLKIKLQINQNGKISTRIFILFVELLVTFSIKIEASLTVNNSMSKGLRVKWY
jgi:hypothetical protein